MGRNKKIGQNVKSYEVSPYGASNDFETSLYINNAIYYKYVFDLMNMYISSIKIKGLPETVDESYFFRCVLERGSAVFFRDENMSDEENPEGMFLGLPFTESSGHTLYNKPNRYRAYSEGAPGYLSKVLTPKNSVILYHDELHTSPMESIYLFARKLFNINATINININAQKTPVVIVTDDPDNLTFKNFLTKFDGNQPYIWTKKNLALNDALQVLDIHAPYVADKLKEQFIHTWNEALTSLGISNISYDKKERQTTVEASRSIGGTVAFRNIRLQQAEKFCEQVKKIFGLDLEFVYREEEEKGKITQGEGGGENGEIHDPNSDNSNE